MNKTPLISFKNFSFSYGQEEILKNISFDVLQGEFLCIVGPNGAGKSTLLKCLHRLVEGGCGQIEINGHALSSISRKELAKTMGTVPQTIDGTAPFTVYEFVKMGRYPYSHSFKSSSHEDKGMIQRALQSTGIEHFSHRKLSDLSGGERQKVYIAAALAQGTKILLMDEPTTFLDPKYQVDIYHTLKKLNEEDGITIILVTHDFNMGSMFSNRILALKEGKSVFDGNVNNFMKNDILEPLFGIPFHILNGKEGLKPMAIQKSLL